MPENLLSGKKILFFITEDWYFWSHRLSLALAVQKVGAEVVVVAREGEHRERIEAKGFVFHDIPINRSGLNPLKDILLIIRVFILLLRERPDIVHNIAVKPVLYGSMVSFMARVPIVINAMAGLGFLYISKSRFTWVLRKLFEGVVIPLSNRRNSRLIVQNSDDYKFFIELGVSSGQIVKILGSGVNVQHYTPKSEKKGKPVATFVARMLGDKGVYELVDAARILQARKVNVIIRLFGKTDTNPSSVPESKLLEWQKEGLVEYRGHSTDIAKEYALSHIAVLPSYREGLPKSLLEAASCGRAIVATDVPGCREVCIDGTTGILVPVKDHVALADAIEELAINANLRQSMGRAARQMVLERFSDEIIGNEIINLYAAMLDSR